MQFRRRRLPLSDRQHYDDDLCILPSALKHGIDPVEIRHALTHVLRYLEQEYDGEIRVFVIGAGRDGTLSELVLVPADTPARVIHADLLQANHLDFL